MKTLPNRMGVVGVIALLMLAAAGCGGKNNQGDSMGQAGPSLPSTGSASPLNQPVDQSDSQAGPVAEISGEVGPVSPQVSLADGPTLLQDHCAKCHSVHALERSERSRSDWEKILSRMERRGVRLSEEERDALLFYLVIPDKP